MLQLTTKLMNMFNYFITKYILFPIIKITILVVISIQYTKHTLKLVSHISLHISLKGLKGDICIILFIRANLILFPTDPIFYIYIYIEDLIIIIHVINLI